MKIFSRHRLLDFIVILLNITYGLTIIQVYTLDLFAIRSDLVLLFFTIIAYFIRFGTSFSFIKNKTKSGIIYLFFAIYVIDFVQNLLCGRLYLQCFFSAINVFFFMEYLYSLYIESGESDGVSKLLFSHRAFSIYNIVVVFLCAILILVGVLSPTDNQIATNSLTLDNTSGEHVYFFPGYLSLALDSSRLLDFLNIPVLTGLSHEPHTLCLLIVPFLFYVQSEIKSGTKKILLIVLSLLLLIISTSSTAILAFSIIFVFDVIWNLFRKGGRFYLVLLILSGLFLVRYGGNIFDMVQSEILMKTTTETGSMDYSLAMLKYVVSPQGIIGYGNYPDRVGLEILNYNIGLITCLFDLILFICLIWKTIKLSLSKSNDFHYIGLACLYFLVHGLKINILLFGMPYFAFMIMIIELVSKEQKTK